MDVKCIGVKKLGIPPHMAPKHLFSASNRRPSGCEPVCKVHKIQYNKARNQGTIEVARHKNSMSSRFLVALQSSKEAALQMLKEEATVNENDCWVWNHSTISGGYASFRVGTKAALEGVPRFQMVHKWAYWLAYGDTDLTIHHKCALKKCFNPDHLEPVTLSQNIGEMLARKDYVTRIRQLEHEVDELKLRVKELEKINAHRG